MSLSKTLGWLLLVSVGIALRADGGKRYALAEAGRARAEIVVGARADKAARFAAADLKWHLDKITGADFKVVAEDEATTNVPVRILVGSSSLTAHRGPDLAEQEFVVCSRPGVIELIGRDAEDKGTFVYRNDDEGVVLKNAPGFYDLQGTMYAVYDFLTRECGVVWADTTDLGTVLPNDPNLAVSVTDRRKTPYFAYRGGTIDGYRLNPLFWKRGSAEENAFKEFAYAHPTRYDDQDRLFRLRHRIGGRKANANHSFYHYYGKYWKENDKNFIRKWPEIFAQGYEGVPPQMCYSSKAFINLVIRDVRAYFDQDPETGKFRWGKDNYCLEPMDSSFYCKCPDCQRQMEPERAHENGSDSTYWFSFVKTVAEAISESHPGKQISTLAYHSHEALPRGITLPKNVVVYFCVYANRMPYSDMLGRQLARMKAWREAYPGQPLAMWLYNTFPLEHTDKGGFHCFPGFFANEAYRQFQFFKANDIRAGIFHCGFNGEVDNYMHLEWMIDPDRKPEELLDEYFCGFGKAAVPLKEFYRTVERRYCDRSRYPKGVVQQTAKLAWGGDDIRPTMEKLAHLMHEAEEQAATSDEKRRVVQWKLAVWDYMKMGYEQFVARQGAPKPEWRARRIPVVDGNLEAVPWADLPEVPFRLHNAGDDQTSTLSGAARCAHDGMWLYLELDLRVPTADCHASPGIFPSDTWELFFARQEAIPYRHYASSPDGRMTATSNGEVNWRMNVAATESGPACYGAKVSSDLGTPDCWVQRFAFPFATMLDRSVAPGDTIYLNCVSVLGKRLLGPGDTFIQTVTPSSTVHTTDRMGRVILED